MTLPNPGFDHDRPSLAGRPVSRAMLLLIRLYQTTAAAWLGGQCRFHPSCSRYCAEAIVLHGPLRGALLGLGRILRCNPLFKGGYDPVPPRRG